MGLVVLQVIGGISIAPYPFILVANIMSIAAEGPGGWQRVRAAAPFVLLSLYPFVWLALYKWSWRAMARGETGWAFGVSSVPVVLSLAAVAAWIISDGREKRRRPAR